MAAPYNNRGLNPNFRSRTPNNHAIFFNNAKQQLHGSHRYQNNQFGHQNFSDDVQKFQTYGHNSEDPPVAGQPGSLHGPGHFNRPPPGPRFHPNQYQPQNYAHQPDPFSNRFPPPSRPTQPQFDPFNTSKPVESFSLPNFNQPPPRFLHQDQQMTMKGGQQMHHSEENIDRHNSNQFLSQPQGPAKSTETQAQTLKRNEDTQWIEALMKSRCISTSNVSKHNINVYIYMIIFLVILGSLIITCCQKVVLERHYYSYCYLVKQ